MSDDTLFGRVGGDQFFNDLVEAFYEGIATDELLAPLYPDYPDFGPARERLSLFLIQYWEALRRTWSIVAIPAFGCVTCRFTLANANVIAGSFTWRQLLSRTLMLSGALRTTITGALPKLRTT